MSRAAGLLQLLPLSKRVILGVKVTPGNVHDSQAFEDVLEEAARLVPATQAVVTDAGYKTPAICKTLQEREIRPVLPYTRPQTKESFFKKHEYVYNDHYNCYLYTANRYCLTKQRTVMVIKCIVKPGNLQKWRPGSGRPIAPLPRLQ
ncbi:transposase [Paenibacillus dendritiformis]|uniref:transposase n=1 Tax=Paenibacillus dendritiformis TaxID=130049 RepID=UPI00366A1887